MFFSISSIKRQCQSYDTILSKTAIYIKGLRIQRDGVGNWNIWLRLLIFIKLLLNQNYSNSIQFDSFSFYRTLKVVKTPQFWLYTSDQIKTKSWCFIIYEDLIRYDENQNFFELSIMFINLFIVKAKKSIIWTHWSL